MAALHPPHAVALQVHLPSPFDLLFHSVHTLSTKNVHERMCVYKSFITRETTTSKDWGKKKKKSETFMQEKNINGVRGKKMLNSHAGNRTPATAVRAPDPNH